MSSNADCAGARKNVGGWGTGLQYHAAMVTGIDIQRCVGGDTHGVEVGGWGRRARIGLQDGGGPA